jgi:ClpP class serine protease
LGTDAKERGLIDEFGGVMDAVEEAARRAGVTRDYQLAQFPEVSWKSALRQLATPGLPSVFAGDEEMEAVQVDGMPQLMHILGRPLEALQNLQAFAVGEPLAMLPFSYVVEDGFPGADVATQ